MQYASLHHSSEFIFDCIATKKNKTLFMNLSFDYLHEIYKLDKTSVIWVDG